MKCYYDDRERRYWVSTPCSGLIGLVFLYGSPLDAPMCQQHWTVGYSMAVGIEFFLEESPWFEEALAAWMEAKLIG